MSTTIVNDAVSAVMAALQAAPAIADKVDRVRQRPLPAGLSTMVVVRPDGFAPVVDELAVRVVAWDVPILIDLYARVPAGVAADVAIDPLLKAVGARLAQDPTLGGAVLSLSPGQGKYDFDADGDATVCVITLFTARQRTAGAHL